MSRNRFKVLEVGNGLPVWYAGRILMTLGAEVLRVEPPGGVEVWAGDVEAYWVLNRTKGLLEADLSTTEGRARLREALSGIDVLLLGVRPPTAERWRLRPQDLRDLPDLVHVSLTAFGTGGPYERQAAHDLNAVAVTGVAWVHGLGGAEGQLAQSTPISDLLSGLFAVIGVLEALRERSAGMIGPICREVSMAEASLAGLAAWGPWLLARRAERLDGIPWYGLYRSADGQLLAVGAMERWQQERIAERGRAAGEVDGMGEAEVARIIASATAEEWLTVAEREGVAISKVVPPWRALHDPHLAARIARDIRPEDPWARLLYPVVNPCRRAATSPNAPGFAALLFPPDASGRLGARPTASPVTANRQSHEEVQ